MGAAMGAVPQEHAVEPNSGRERVIVPVMSGGQRCRERCGLQPYLHLCNRPALPQMPGINAVTAQQGQLLCQETMQAVRQSEAGGAVCSEGACCAPEASASASAAQAMRATSSSSLRLCGRLCCLQGGAMSDVAMPHTRAKWQSRASPPVVVDTDVAVLCAGRRRVSPD